MRVFNVVLVFTMALLATTCSDAALTVTNTSQTGPKLIKGDAMRRDNRRLLRSYKVADVDEDSSNEERDGLLEIPKHLEEMIEKPHHIREIFTEWCLEGKIPEKAAKEANPGTEDAKTAELYKIFISYHSGNGVTGRKPNVIECNV